MAAISGESVGVGMHTARGCSCVAEKRQLSWLAPKLAVGDSQGHAPLDVLKMFDARHDMFIAEIPLQMVPPHLVALASSLDEL